MAAQLVTKREGLTGGATGVSGDVDGISATDRGDGNALQEGDLCDVVVSGNVFNYKYSSGTADVENSPYLIKPDTGAASGYAWILQNKIAGLDTSTTVADADKIEVVKDSTGLSAKMARSDFMDHNIAYHDDTTATGVELNTLTDGSIAGVLHDHARVVFPATAVPSSDPNTLDDYEEGTWTPSWTNATGTSTGTYTKIGRLVFYTAKLVVTAVTGGVGVSGYPFTLPVRHTPNVMFLDFGSTYITGMTSESGTTIYAVNMANGTALALSSTVPIIWASNDEIYVSGMYEI